MFWSRGCNPPRNPTTSFLLNGGAGDGDVLPATRRTRMNGHDRGADQADRMFDHRPNHFLASFAANQAGFAVLISHGKSLSESLDQFGQGVKANRAWGLRGACGRSPAAPSNATPRTTRR